MNSISMVALLVHIFVVISAVRFLAARSRCRNKDTSLVAALAAFSVGIILLHVVNAWWQHQYNVPITFTDSVMGVVSLVNAILYLALIRATRETMLTRRQRH